MAIRFGGWRADDISGTGRKDYLFGFSGDDRILGAGGDDRIFGGWGEDFLDGGADDDLLDGGFGDDILVGGAGDDSIYGGFGEDTAVFAGSVFDYEITSVRSWFFGSYVRVTDIGSGFNQGSDILRGVEFLQFDDLRIDLSGGNNGPLARDDVFSTDEDTDLAGNVFADNGGGADIDFDGDALSVSAVNGDANAVGVQVTLASGALLTLFADGTFDYDVNGAFDFLPDGGGATDSFTYTLSDGNGGSDTATVTIDVAGLNDDPNAVDDAFSITESQFLNNGRLLANDTDAEDDSLTILESTANGVTRPSQSPPFTVTSLGGRDATVFVGDGLAPSGNDFLLNTGGNFEDLAAGQTDTILLTYLVSDGNGGTDTASVTVTINGENDGPVAVDDSFLTDEDTAFSGDVLADNGNGPDADVDDGDILTVTGVNGAAANVGAQITLASGALLTLNADGSFDYDPNGAFEALNDGDVDRDSFSYTISDGLEEATATVSIDIDGVTDIFPPPIPDGQVWVFDENQELLAVYSMTGGTDPNGNAIIVSSFPINEATVGPFAGENHTVAVGAGEFLTSFAPITILFDGMQLYGAQWGVDPRAAAGLREPGSAAETIINGALTTQVFKIQADDVLVNGFEFFGSSGDLLVTDGVGGNGGNSGFVGSYNILRDAGDDGFSIFKHTGAVVEYNLIFATNDGIEIRGNVSGIFPQPAEGFDNVVRFNEVDGGFGNAGIYAFGAVNTTITDNYVHDYEGDSGIVMGTRRGFGSEYQDGGVVSNNLVERSGENGIDVFQSDVVVTGNTVRENAGWAVSVGIDYNNESRAAVKPDNVTITDNVFEGNNLVKNVPVTSGPGSTPDAGPVRIVNGATNITVDDNQLIGDGGDNLLASTSGDDSFDGLAGLDVFLFSAAQTSDGVIAVDTVNYVDGDDIIDLGGATVASFDEATPGQVTLTLDGADGDQVVVLGADLFAEIDFIGGPALPDLDLA